MTVDLVMELSPPSEESKDAKPLPSQAPLAKDTKPLPTQSPPAVAGGIYEDEETKNTKDRKELARAFNEFHKRIESKTEDQKKLERNQIQGRLIGASELACTEFQRNLNNVQSGGNFMLGSVSTILAGAGAIVTQVDTARLLSGSSAMFSGVRSEFNSDYFYKQTAAFITKAIDTWRKETKETLRLAQQKKYGEYTVEDAIADAIAYNDGCSLIAGLQRVSEAVAVEDDPGLQRLSKLLNNSGKIKASNEGLVLTVSRLPALQAEVSAQIKGTSTPDYEFNAATLHVNQSHMALSMEIDKLGENGKGAASDLNRVKKETIGEFDKLKTESDTLTTSYFNSVKKLNEEWQSEQNFMSARVEFYDQLAKISNFKQKIDLWSQAFDHSLKSIREDLAKLKPSPAGDTKTGDQAKPPASTSPSASTSQPDTNQAGDKVQTNKPAQSDAAVIQGGK